MKERYKYKVIASVATVLVFQCLYKQADYQQSSKVITSRLLTVDYNQIIGSIQRIKLSIHKSIMICYFSDFDECSEINQFCRL